MEEVTRNKIKLKQKEVKVNYVIDPIVPVGLYDKLWQDSIIDGIQHLLKDVPRGTRFNIQVGETKQIEISYGISPMAGFEGNTKINMNWLEEEKDEQG